jgi:ABC-2 type transport system ATP-binding protein
MGMIVEVKNLKKQYGELKAVDGLNLSIEENIIYGLLGPNGAGKSTTISMISTLIKPTDGQILVGGYDVVKEASNVRKLIGLVPQDIALYPNFSAGDNLTFFGRMYGLSGKKLHSRVDEVLDIVGLRDRKKDNIEGFSGGMKRRINIGVGLINNPKLLILDEPTVGIDPQSRNHILETVKYLNTQGMSVIYTSHYMEEVEFLCSHLAIMDKGRVIAEGTKEEVKKLEGNYQKIQINCTIDDNVLTETKSLKYVEEAIYEKDEELLLLMVEEASAVLGDIVTFINQKGIKIRSVKIEEQNLEGVFLKLTGRALRD